MKLEAQCEQLQLKVRTLHLDWETEQKRSLSYFNQIMELEKERDQVIADLITPISINSIGLSAYFSFCHPLLFNRLCAVETACSWSTPTVCWIRTVCVNTSLSCRPTWSSSRGSWRGRGVQSRWNTATPVWTVWVNSTSARRARRPFPRRVYESLFLLSSPTCPCVVRTSVMALAALLAWNWDPRSMAAVCRFERLSLVWRYLLLSLLVVCGIKELHIYCCACCYYMLKECSCLYLFSPSEVQSDVD